MSSSLKTLSLLEKHHLKALGLELTERLESIVELCTKHGIDLDEYTVFQKDERGEIDTSKPPLPNYDKLQKYIERDHASVSVPILIGGISELSDIISQVRAEVERR